ncbi:unnamed protein product [Trifolium pratense]|nr:unnamed protein product [Trifolium pratense]
MTKLSNLMKDKERVLVHCMSAKSRSPVVVSGYLMKSRGWRLAQSYQWLKECRTSVELSEGAYHSDQSATRYSLLVSHLQQDHLQLALASQKSTNYLNFMPSAPIQLLQFLPEHRPT